MSRTLCRIFVGAFLMVFGPRAWAEHFSIDLRAKASSGEKSAGMDTSPPVGGVNPRPVLQVRANEELQITWFMTNVYPHGTLKNLVLHCYIAREDVLGQKAPPSNVEKDHVLETSFELSLAFKAKAGGRFKVKVPQAGRYLLRVESIGTQGVTSDHEHFAAIDLDVH